MARLHTYLHTHRKRLGLTQQDIALLAGVQGRGTISRFERQAREPSFETLVAFHIIFDVPLEVLFPGIYQEVEHAIRNRARYLAASLVESPHLPRARHRAQALRAIADRQRRAPLSYEHKKQ